MNLYLFESFDKLKSALQLFRSVFILLNFDIQTNLDLLRYTELFSYQLIIVNLSKFLDTGNFKIVEIAIRIQLIPHEL